MRTIFHVDMDAFFVSVEERHDPSLKGKVVVVGGPRGERGVVSAASYAARRYGVHSAMPLKTASALLPRDAIFLEGHPHRYSEASHQVCAILESFTPLVEMASIDEAYLDMTGTEKLHGPPLAAAHKLHAAVKNKTQLNCSIGIATSRMVAKVSSDQAKPNGILWIVPGQEAAFLAPLDVRKIPGVGKVTEKHLHEIGIRKVGDLARLDEAFLRERFGAWGLALAGKARGLDAGAWFDGEVGAHEEAKSISHEHTFGEDTRDAAQVEAVLARMAEMVGRRLREQGFWTRTVQIKLRYEDFTTLTRARTLEQPTQIDTVLVAESRALLHANWERGRAIRLIGVHAGNLVHEPGQLSLLGGESELRWEKALKTVDTLRDRFGESAVATLGSLQGRFRERVHENPASLPGKKPKR